MSTPKQTPRLWRTVPFICHGSRIGIQDADGKWVGEEGYSDVEYIPRFNPEHARRIVACVNACEGLKTELLENIALLGDTLASRFKLRDQTERNLNQELLEFVEEVRRTGDTRLSSMAIAVIAKATGEAK